VTPPSSSRPRVSAAIALLLLAPVPTIGVVAALHAAPGPVGDAVFAAAKLWLLLFPAAWFVLVERGRPGWSRPGRAGLRAGLLLGSAMAAAIGLAYWGVLRDLVDPRPLRQAALEMGIGSPAAYLAGAAGWTFANSLVEEYVWRWFVLRQLRALLPAAAAILGSAALFTAHHVFALAASPSRMSCSAWRRCRRRRRWSWLYLRFASSEPGLGQPHSSPTPRSFSSAGSSSRLSAPGRMTGCAPRGLGA
jgi:membrane protease YdiL (CAAX protease family)